MSEQRNVGLITFEQYFQRRMSSLNPPTRTQVLQHFQEYAIIQKEIEYCLQVRRAITYLTPFDCFIKVLESITMMLTHQGMLKGLRKEYEGLNEEGKGICERYSEIIRQEAEERKLANARHFSNLKKKSLIPLEKIKAIAPSLMLPSSDIIIHQNPKINNRPRPFIVCEFCPAGSRKFETRIQLYRHVEFSHNNHFEECISKRYESPLNSLRPSSSNVLHEQQQQPVSSTFPLNNEAPS